MSKTGAYFHYEIVRGPEEAKDPYVDRVYIPCHKIAMLEYDNRGGVSITLDNGQRVTVKGVTSDSIKAMMENPINNFLDAELVEVVKWR